MKLKFLWIAMLAAGMAACSDDDELHPDNPSEGDGQEQAEPEVKAEVAAYVSPSPSYPEYVREMLDNRFTNQTSLDAAQVAFFTNDDLATCGEEIDDFYDAGGMVVLIGPDKEDYMALADRYDHPDAIPSYPGQGVLMFAYNHQTAYSIMTDEEPAESSEVKEDELTDEELKLMEESTAAEGDEDVVDTGEEPVYNYDTLSDRFDLFVDWLNENTEMQAPLRYGILRSSGDDGYSSSNDLSNSYFEVYNQLPVELRNKIRKMAGSEPRWLSARGEITVNYKIRPVFQYSCNSDYDAPGDYYILEGSVTAHNGQVWEPTKSKCGAYNIYMLGYYMSSMSVTSELLDDSMQVIPGVKFYKEPYPTTVNSSQTFEDEHTYGFKINGSLSVGYEKGGVSGGGELAGGYSTSWRSNVSQTLYDVNTLRNTSSPATVNYVYSANLRNFDFHTSFNDAKDYGRGYPALTRTDMDCPVAWAWKVPYGAAGVTDESTRSMSIRVSVQAIYAVHSWYGGLKSGREDNFSNSPQSFEQHLPAPVRARFGVFALKNAAHSAVANIKIWKQGDAATAAPYATIPSSYSFNELARIKLPVGTYCVEFDTIDPDVGNQKTGTWKCENIVVKMGHNEEESTTEVSTVNATQVK